MTTSNPWWGSGLFTIAGVLITTLGASVLAILNRRTERRRLSRKQKVETYPELLYAAHRLTRLPVWPVAAGDPEELRDEIDRAAQRIRLFAPEPVDGTVTGLLAAADSSPRPCAPSARRANPRTRTCSTSAMPPGIARPSRAADRDRILPRGHPGRPRSRPALNGHRLRSSLQRSIKHGRQR